MSLRSIDHPLISLFRKVASWIEIVLGACLLVAGFWLLLPYVSTVPSDPHGLNAQLAALAIALGASLLTAGLCLRLSGRWPWLVQLVPLAAFTAVGIFLVG
jgi:predicted phage tail protein